MPRKHDCRTSSTGKARLLGGLADTVVDMLVETQPDPACERLERAVDLLYRTATGTVLPGTAEVIEMLVVSGVSDVELHDICIGEVARRLGEDWVQDRRGFAEVSRSSAWLYGLCKSIGDKWSSGVVRSDERCVILATVPGESHLLGPAVLAQKLRRAGHSVSVCCNESPLSLINRLNSGDHDGLLISVATQDGLENARQAVTSIRRGLSARRPIILGGAALEFCGEQAAKSGVDLVTNDEQMALEVLGAQAVAPCVGAAE